MHGCKGLVARLPKGTEASPYEVRSGLRDETLGLSIASLFLTITYRRRDVLDTVLNAASSLFLAWIDDAWIMFQPDPGRSRPSLVPDVEDVVAGPYVFPRPSPSVSIRQRSSPFVTIRHLLEDATTIKNARCGHGSSPR